MADTKKQPITRTAYAVVRGGTPEGWIDISTVSWEPRSSEELAGRGDKQSRALAKGYPALRVIQISVVERMTVREIRRKS